MIPADNSHLPQELVAEKTKVLEEARQQQAQDAAQVAALSRSPAFGRTRWYLDPLPRACSLTSSRTFPHFTRLRVQAQELREKLQGLEAGMEARRRRMATLQSRPQFALIVAVSTYTLSKYNLPNPRIDAHRLQATLEDLGGWTIVMVLDQTKKQADRMIKKFVSTVQNADGDCLVAFIGHGTQTDGRNYLLAADSEFDETYPNDKTYEQAAKDVCISFNDVQVLFKNAQTTFAWGGATVFLLDCCRIGLAKGGVNSGVPSLLENSAVIYSTNSGEVADDGAPGKGGAFMKITCGEIQKRGVEGVELCVVMQETRTQLLAVANQLVCSHFSLYREFFLWKQVSRQPLSRA